MKQKVKILFILHLPPPVHGAAMMGKYLQESKLLNNQFECDYINLSTSESLDRIGKGGIDKLLVLLKICGKTLRAIFNKKYDICYMTLTAKGPGFYKDFLIVIILKLFRKKIIYHFHNKGVEQNRKNKLNDLLYKVTFKNTKSILLSPHLFIDIANYAYKENVYFCPNGIPDEFAKVEINNSIEETSSSIRLLFLSNMMTEKGVFILIEACRILNSQNIPFECHFVGDFSETPKSEFDRIIVEEGLEGRVFFHGKKMGDQKLWYYHNSDIFVFPTYYHNECFPLVILEAMQIGLPVISTFEGGIPDLIDEAVTGFLVPQKNTQALADKLKFLINNKDLRQAMGLAGQKRFNELFTLQKFELNISEILKSAIEK